MSKHQKDKEQARQKAIEFSYNQEKLLKLAKRYGLVKEFLQNGII